MIIKFSSEPNEVFFIECTRETGVVIKSFSQMKPIIKSMFKKIVLRHIEWSRPDSAVQTLKQFIEETKDCTYAAPIAKILRK